MKTEDMILALRLIGWCKNIDRACERNFSGIFRPSLMKALEGAKLVRAYSEKYGWRLTPAGYQWLTNQGYPLPADSHTQLPGRRFENAAVVVTMLCAGIDPFHDTLHALTKPSCYLPAYTLRAKGRNVLGSNQIVGFFRTADDLYTVHIPAAQRRIVWTREQECADKIMLGCGCRHSTVLFCGSSYSAIYRAIFSRPAEEKLDAKKVSYATFYERSDHVMLVPCNASGVLQLRLLQVPAHRSALRRALGGIDDASMVYCDFLDPHYHIPVCIATDMELGAIVYAGAEAKAAGYDGLLLAVFAAQKSFLRKLFPPPFYHFAIIPDDVLLQLEEGADHATV